MEKRGIPILIYHSISNDASSSLKRWTMPPEMFDDHLTYLRDRHYTPITVSEFVRARARGHGALPDRPVLLTFDDGYADFYVNAFPALQRHGVVATLYVVTACVGKKCTWLPTTEESPRPMVTWSQLQEIAASGMVECGGHSHTHPKLDSIPYHSAHDEIVTCRTVLEDHLGCAVSSFAYPHGWYTRTLERIVLKAGYTSACAVKNMRSCMTENAFELARLMVTEQTDVDGLKQLLGRDVSWGEAKLRSLARRTVRFAPQCQARVMPYLPRRLSPHEKLSLEQEH